MSAYTGYESYSDTELIRICRDSATSRCFVELIQRVETLPMDIEKIADGEFECLKVKIEERDDEIEQLDKEAEYLRDKIRELEGQLDIANSTIERIEIENQTA